MPGDRKSTCGGRMRPIGLQQRSDGEIMIVHECLSCGKIRTNRIAGDDQPDEILSLLTILSTKHHIRLLDPTSIQDVRIALFGIHNV